MMSLLLLLLLHPPSLWLRLMLGCPWVAIISSLWIFLVLIPSFLTTTEKVWNGVMKSIKDSMLLFRPWINCWNRANGHWQWKSLTTLNLLKSLCPSLTGIHMLSSLLQLLLNIHRWWLGLKMKDSLTSKFGMFRSWSKDLRSWRNGWKMMGHWTKQQRRDWRKSEKGKGKGKWKEKEIEGERKSES